MHTKNCKTIKQGAIGSYIRLIHVLVKHTDYKVSVIECASFGDEFCAMLSRPKVVVMTSWRRALWYIAMKHYVPC